MNAAPRSRRLFVAAVILGCGWNCSTARAEDEAPAECRWAEGKLTIDGEANEPAWQKAQRIDNFHLPWLRDKDRPARRATKARLLWDREALYFFAEMEDTDIYADVKEHDGRLWLNDVFEVFLKPADDKPGYYEFQVNAAGSVLDMFIPRRGAGGYERFKSDGEFHITAKVKLRGTLNRWSDRDEGWSVEGRIPWRDFLRSGGRPEPGETWGFALARYDYSVDFEGPELSTSAPLDSKTRPDFHLHEDYARLRFVRPAPEDGARKYGLQLYAPTSRVIGSPDPPPPYRVVRTLPKLKLSWPICVVRQPGSRRLWLVDQQQPYGRSRVVRTGDDPVSGTIETLLDFETAVAYDIAFHPHFAENGYVFIGVNGAFGGEVKKTRVVRYTVDRSTAKLDADSAKVIIEWASDGHNGGAVCFGNDGMLYVTSGDGTSDSDTDIVGQRLDLLTAKVLRIDVDHPEGDRAYSVPPDNPFVDLKDARPETWAYGLRNPWRIACDPVTGAIWVGNNGQDLWEQVYLVERGANYGWSVYEGSHEFYPRRRPGPTPHVKPTLEHPHSQARSLTGGVVYYGERLPKLRGAYIYGDHSTGKIWAARHDGEGIAWHREIADSSLRISGFGLDADGELLIVDHHADSGLFTLEPQADDQTNRQFPRRLSETGLFRSVARHEVQPGVIPYEVNSPLWSDGAIKRRYLALPPTTEVDGEPQPSRIGFKRRGGWNFPDRTVLVKSFALQLNEGDPASQHWVETRLLTRQQGEWVGYSYAWNDEQTEATLVAAAGADRDYAVTTADERQRRQTWRYPSRTECMVCHSRAANFVLGLSTVQMNCESEYNGLRANQLAVLESLGLLRTDPRRELLDVIRGELRDAGVEQEKLDERVKEITATRDQRPWKRSALLFQPPEKYANLVDPHDEDQPLDLRARSYLHANCAQCHVPAGGGNAQMDLRFDATGAQFNVFDVRPQHHTFGIENARLVAPGQPGRSVLLHRVAIRERGQMPQLATDLVDQEAVEMLRRWIAAASGKSR